MAKMLRVSEGRPCHVLGRPGSAHRRESVKPRGTVGNKAMVLAPAESLTNRERSGCRDFWIGLNQAR